LEKTGVILAGGFSRRFGQDKGFLMLKGKPLILHVIDKVSTIVNQVLVIVSSKSQDNAYNQILSSDVEVVVDKYETQSPLVGALTGFKKARGQYCLLLPCDTPLISTQVLSLLFDLCINNDAAIPRWPNKFIEPLQAIYRTKPALVAAESALKGNKRRMHSMVTHLSKVNYVSTAKLKQLDPKLTTFLNINTPGDMKKAEETLLAMESNLSRPYMQT
jgi:molybdopterin-guanine dinucleotide biosynthesis protein A